MGKDDIKPVMVEAPENRAQTLCLLYTLDVENPHPDQELKEIEFRTRYKQVPASPMLLGVTALKE